MCRKFSLLVSLKTYNIDEGVDFYNGGTAGYAVCKACTAGCKVCSFAVADATETC